MQKDIHPKLNKVKFVLPNDDFFIGYSAAKSGKVGKDGIMEYLVDVHFEKHPAWNKDEVSKAKADHKKVSQFRDKYGDL